MNIDTRVIGLNGACLGRMVCHSLKKKKRRNRSIAIGTREGVRRQNIMVA